ncbi:hypothetical protein EVAR_41921_1 [Eumeta japonica]|uniref:Uncharacterized protein n=1 Tax=Eumeta variegata TaxID=151549 RepID=A0A4C1XJI3_EUMVA|nr:hypothetical protein EVAR_41921_1 [Eumeta japonica]
MYASPVASAARALIGRAAYVTRPTGGRRRVTASRYAVREGVEPKPRIKIRNKISDGGRSGLMEGDRGTLERSGPPDLLLTGRKSTAETKYPLYYASVVLHRHIERRLNAGNKVNGASLAVINSKSVSRQARLAIHNAVLIPMLMYGSENWVRQKKNGSKNNAVEMLGSMCGVSPYIHVETVKLGSGVVGR